LAGGQQIAAPGAYRGGHRLFEANTLLQRVPRAAHSVQVANTQRAAGIDRRFEAVHADTLRFFPELVTELGGDPAALLEDVGLSAGALHKGVDLSYRAIATLMEHAAKQLRCADFGLRLAARQGGGAVFGALGLVMKHAATLGAGLRYVADHSHAHSLAARVRMEHEPTSGKTFVAHDVLVDRLPVKRQMTEQFMLLAQLNAREVSGGKAAVREVRFRFQPLSPLSSYQRYFDCAVRFDQSADGVVFREADLASPSARSDPERFEEARAFIAAHYRAEPPLTASVRALILQHMESRDCSKERVAAWLHMHPRTLLRRLTSEGTCFEEVKDSVRRDVTLGYLRATRLSMQRIAEKVGYAEQSVLARSCSRWFAASPRAIRRQALSRTVEILRAGAGDALPHD
jgi:AraC-like DNA-binding protein